MKNRMALIIGGALLSLEAGWLLYRRNRTPSRRDQRTQPEPRFTGVDLNSAGSEQLSQLGLDGDSVTRIVENRPYRNKLELVSRIIVPEDVYGMIKDRIVVNGAGEPVKVA
jgi:LPXTG-motif cell wall-anchored protein